MPSIALLCGAPTADDFPQGRRPVAPQLQPRISTSLTDVTKVKGMSVRSAAARSQVSTPALYRRLASYRLPIRAAPRLPVRANPNSRPGQSRRLCFRHRRDPVTGGGQSPLSRLRTRASLPAQTIPHRTILCRYSRTLSSRAIFRQRCEAVHIQDASSSLISITKGIFAPTRCGGSAPSPAKSTQRCPPWA